MDTIGVIGLAVAIVAVVAAIVVPEIRRFIGLDKPKKNDTSPIAERFRKGVDRKSDKAKRNIIYVSNVIGKHVDEIEAAIGRPSEISTVKVGQLEPVPDGGESRDYKYGEFLLSITYDKDGTAKGIRLEGLQSYSFGIESWFDVLFRMGMSVRKEPDIQGPITRT